MTPRISVCIPSYNRSRYLPDLLDSIISQSYQDYEIVICEDMSPERHKIREIVNSYQRRFPNFIKYYENESNFGYDANFRNLIDKASGDYCLIMGNDDLMAQNALATVDKAIGNYPDIGVVLRSYVSFHGSPDRINQIHRYFSEERFFPAGKETVITFFYRLVVMSGIVLNRREALKYRTDQFDGKMFYQMHLAANILLTMNGVFLPDILILCRSGEAPEFGNCPAERGLFTPGTHTCDMDLRMLEGILEIARETESSRQVKIFAPILKDIGNYSYATLAYHAALPFSKFIDYYRQLCKLGLGKNFYFHIYFLAILTIGRKRIERFIKWLRSRMGHTPTLGGRYAGESQKDQWRSI